MFILELKNYIYTNQLILDFAMYYYSYLFFLRLLQYTFTFD